MRPSIGIADGRRDGDGGDCDGGDGEAFALGAQDPLIGTRFVSAPEAKIHLRYRKAGLAAAAGRGAWEVHGKGRATM